MSNLIKLLCISGALVSYAYTMDAIQEEKIDTRPTSTALTVEHALKAGAMEDASIEDPYTQFETYIEAGNDFYDGCNDHLAPIGIRYLVTSTKVNIHVLLAPYDKRSLYPQTTTRYETENPFLDIETKMESLISSILSGHNDEPAHIETKKRSLVADLKLKRSQRADNNKIIGYYMLSLHMFLNNSQEELPRATADKDKALIRIGELESINDSTQTEDQMKLAEEKLNSDRRIISKYEELISKKTRIEILITKLASFGYDREKIMNETKIYSAAPASPHPHLLNNLTGNITVSGYKTVSGYTTITGYIPANSSNTITLNKTVFGFTGK